MWKEDPNFISLLKIFQLDKLINHFHSEHCEIIWRYEKLLLKWYEGMRTWAKVGENIMK